MAIPPSRSILFVTSAIVLAVLSAGNPLALFANATASILGSSAALTSDEIALFSKTGSQTETEISKPAAEALFKQFQVWAAAEDARARVQPSGQQPPGNGLPSPGVKHARSEVRPPQTHRPAHTARREVRLAKHARHQVRYRRYALAHWAAPIGWSERHFAWRPARA
jgi:hypothetical protein